MYAFLNYICPARTGIRYGSSYPLPWYGTFQKNSFSSFFNLLLAQLPITQPFKVIPHSNHN